MPRDRRPGTCDPCHHAVLRLALRIAAHGPHALCERVAKVRQERDEARAEVERLRGVVQHLEAKRATSYCAICGRVGPNADCDSGLHRGKQPGEAVAELAMLQASNYTTGTLPADEDDPAACALWTAPWGKDK